jgi:hypothetical protein
LIAHPLSEIVWLIGFKKLSYKIHDNSVPKDPELHLRQIARKPQVD